MMAAAQAAAAEALREAAHRNGSSKSREQMEQEKLMNLLQNVYSNNAHQHSSNNNVDNDALDALAQSHGEQLLNQMMGVATSQESVGGSTIMGECTNDMEVMLQQLVAQQQQQQQQQQQRQKETEEQERLERMQQQQYQQQQYHQQQFQQQYQQQQFQPQFQQQQQYQEQQQQQQQEAQERMQMQAMLQAQSAMEAAVAAEKSSVPLPNQPQQHYMTVAQDGTILEATETVTGFPPNALLMTSWYDTVFEDDLPGFVAIKTQFWDNGQPSVESFIRRRNMDGDWIWLAVRVMHYIDDPVPGAIIEERLVQDEERAKSVNQVTRISAILIQAIQTARREQEVKEQTTSHNDETKDHGHRQQESMNASATNGAMQDGTAGISSSSIFSSPQAAPSNREIPLVAGDALAYQSWLQQASGQAGVELSGVTTTDPLYQIVQAASKQGYPQNDNNGIGGASGQAHQNDMISGSRTSERRDSTIEQLREELMKGSQEQEGRKGFDPMSSLKAVRGEGTRIDLGMIRLTPIEIKLITLVLTSRIKMHELGPLVCIAMNTPGQSLHSALSGFQTESEIQQYLLHQQHTHFSNHRSNSHGHINSLHGNESQMQRSSSGKLRRKHHHHHGFPRSSSRGSSRTFNQFGAQQQQSQHNYQHQQLPLQSRNFGWNHQHTMTPLQQLIHQQELQQQQQLQQQQLQQNLPTKEPLSPPVKAIAPAAISVLNLAYTFIGNSGIDMLGEILYIENTKLETLDISFCDIDERGILSLARALSKRKRRGVAPLKGLILSGNYISYRSAKELGLALSPRRGSKERRKGRKLFENKAGYEEDNESDDDDFDDNDGDLFSPSPGSTRNPAAKRRTSFERRENGADCSKDNGLQLLHLGATSLSADAMYQLLCGLGVHCPLQELSITSNDLGSKGATILVDFLEQKGATHPVMPFLDCLDLSNNSLGNDGTARLTRAIAKRSKAHFKDLRLSRNDIGPGGIETILNKLLQHRIVNLSLDKNSIGDQGCQLVAASMPSMHHLSRLNLSFNQIGSRGVNTLMRALVGCDSITYLGLSGNIMKISGAIAMGFTLSQHPRLEEIDLDNCCLSQAAQCHIVAGILSNRWVPMKYLNGFQAGPPMVAIGALDVFAYNLSNYECFRLRRDEQMKTILQWMESNRAARQNGHDNMMVDIAGQAMTQQQYLTPDFVSTVNEVHGTPSQNSYLRMLGWLGKIPFDEDELTTLRKFFYDIDGGEGDRGSDGYINLKLRGDLLAALDSDVADEIRDAVPELDIRYKGSVGFDLSEMHKHPTETTWDSLLGQIADKIPSYEIENEDEMDEQNNSDAGCPTGPTAVKYNDLPSNIAMDISSHSTRKRTCSELSVNDRSSMVLEGVAAAPPSMKPISSRNSLSSLSRQSMTRSESERSTRSNYSVSGERKRAKPRISMFPQFENKLEELKATAKDMMDNEDDPEQQDVILTQYAEASLTILRQLRYHCMDRGLDGWRQGAGGHQHSLKKRKVLIVDDSLVTRKMVSRAFEKANFIVDTAQNGVEGVKKMKEAIYDIAFMDIDMPVMNGFEATKALRQWEDIQRPGARQPICALTATYVDDFERSELMKFKEAGLDVMESKPCNIPRLFKVVDDVSPMFSDLSISVSQGGHDIKLG